MQEDLHLPLCGVGNGWEPKRQATPRAGVCQAQKTIGNSAREALPSQIRSAVNVPSGDRPSPHHRLGLEPAVRAVKTVNARNAAAFLVPGGRASPSRQRGVTGACLGGPGRGSGRGGVRKEGAAPRGGAEPAAWDTRGARGAEAAATDPGPLLWGRDVRCPSVRHTCSPKLLQKAISHQRGR
ncbi:hypothetical protein NDU88_000385 [Pleurodeles waltl]|uniref:Uncharacterized protein n=1 Tax=Pleurodeles waltl TaxID=8319 RepID=A0AAV7NA69_PLEWA|nr:hypothetical protein NDU88_000385 [Pleurodeles waltl]